MSFQRLLKSSTIAVFGFGTDTTKFAAVCWNFLLIHFLPSRHSRDLFEFDCSFAQCVVHQRVYLADLREWRNEINIILISKLARSPQKSYKNIDKISKCSARSLKFQLIDRLNTKDVTLWTHKKRDFQEIKGNKESNIVVRRAARRKLEMIIGLRIIW